MWSKILILLIGAGLTACSSHYLTAYSAQRIAIADSLQTDPGIDSLLLPYRSALEAEMNAVIGRSEVNLLVERPNSTMGQWVADVVRAYGKDSLRLDTAGIIPVVSLLNTGGLRASLSAGELHVGDIFKVMPFDNVLVALKLPYAQMEEIRDYCMHTGGEPISGFRIEREKILLDGAEEKPEFIWVVTSNFLANGGDNMYFFQKAVDRQLTNVLLRDLLLREVQRTGVIDIQLENRCNPE